MKPALDTRDTGRSPQNYRLLHSTQASSAHSFIQPIFTEYLLCASPVLRPGAQWEQKGTCSLP